jgi:8-oxo-dGTP diphosphatase
VSTTASRPLVGICVVVVHPKDGKILLGKRKGSHGDGEYAAPGGHLEHGESFAGCATREVMEETGVQIGALRFLRVLNCTAYAPKHYVDLAFAAEWKSGEPTVREPDKVEHWDWYDPDELPSPLFSMVPSAIAALLDAHDLALLCKDLLAPVGEVP